MKIMKKDSNNQAKLKGSDDYYSKKYIYRNSILTDIFDNNHARIVHNIYFVVFFGLSVNFIVHNYLRNGEITFGTNNIISSFRNFHLTIFCWCIFFLLTCLGYFIFKLWSKKSSLYSRSYNFLCFSLLIGYYVFAFELCVYFTSIFNMGPAAAFFLATDQTRLLMKLHAFIRSNLSKKVLNEETFPKFNYFFVYLFFPVLVYRDTYPRTEKIRWNFAFCRLLEVVTALFIYSFIAEPILKSTQKFSIEQFTVADIILLIFENSVYGILALLTSFFLVLHSLQNFFAEITQFGDRLFYKDWWNSTDFSEWFRTWNVIVHDWLHLYIYKDAITFITQNNKKLAKFFVFGISAVVHEWVLTCALGFCFPLLFVQFFIVGGLFSAITFPKTSTSNVLVLYGLSFGMSSLITMYGIEFFVRRNISETTQFLVPHLTNYILYR